MAYRTGIASRAVLLAGAATLAGLSAPALAAQEEQPAAEATADEEIVETGDIVVTARRRNEALLDVPIAITAYTGEQLERQGAVDITDIGDTTPNVTLEVSRGTNSTLTAFIRGIGQQDPVGGFEQGVGLYLDDVYINRPQGAVLDIYDVERIEVLRGPQGTLYGRNTIGGAIKYVTRRLSNDPELNVRGTIGTYGQVDIVATGSLPVADVFRVGGSVARLTRDGFGTNFTTGKENYNKDVKAARVSAEIGRDESALLRISADYTKDNSNTRGGHRLIPNQCTTALCTIAPNRIGDDYNSYGALLDPTQKVVSKGIAANGRIEVAEGIVLKSITGYRRDKSATPIDFDALPAVDLDVPAFYKNKQFSQEFQVEYDRGPISGVAGVYYLDANAKTTFDVRITTQLPGFTAFSDGDVDTKTWAVFGDVTYEINDQFSLALGGRYTSDKRHATVLRQTLSGGGSPIFGGLGTVFLTTSDFEGRRHDKAFTPRASVSFKPNDDHHIYLSWAKGFKGGGFDPRGQSTRAPNTDGIPGPPSAEEIYEYMAFDPEKVTSYELGWKGSLFDKRVFAGVAIFRSDYKDMQIPASVGCQIGGQPNFCGETSNAGKARIQGIELEGNARLFGQPGGSRMNFAWSLGYLDAKFKEFITTVAFERDLTPIPAPGRAVDLADDLKIQNTPKWTASGTLSYTSYVADGRLDLSSTLSYRSKSQQFELASPGLDQEGFALLDASAVYELPGGHWTVGLHGKNLTDTRYIVAGYNFLAANPYTGEYFRTPTGGYIPQAGLGRTGILTAYYGNPRQIMFTVGYKL
jgi:iron complex outermembrane recepter protein